MPLAEKPGMKNKFHILLVLFPPPSSLWAQACGLTVATGSAVTLSNTAVTYCSVVISAGATLVIGGAVTLDVTGNADIEGTVYGIGLGYGSLFTLFFGPGAGGFSTGGGGGGGHGGAGGAGGNDGVVSGGSGGPANDNPTDPVLMGSAGGSVNVGGLPPPFPLTGGAAFLLSALSGTVSINGTIDMSGSSSLGGVGFVGVGGGAGGTIAVTAQNILFNGNLNAIGGDGTYVGRGGGGGIIWLCPSLSPVTDLGPTRSPGAMAGPR